MNNKFQVTKVSHCQTCTPTLKLSTDGKYIEIE